MPLKRVKSFKRIEMKNKKLFVLLPDGVGFRNFAYSSFYKLAVKDGFDVVFWNATSFPLSELGFPEIKINSLKLHPLTDIYKKAKVQVELNLSIQRANDKVYDSYRFPFSYSSMKQAAKSVAVTLLTAANSSESGWLRIRNRIKKQERKTAYYQHCLETLQKEKPSIVFCTNQRHINTLAPLLAANELGIPTATFIFSWDNLPKATLVVEADYYFVWSDHMKKELQYYYPYIQSEQIFVTGSPQFELHFNKDILLSREVFFNKHHLDIAKKYVCFSGNDVTTSPDDPLYLEDIAKSVRTLNTTENSQLGVIFRKCPVDFSNRYDSVLKKYAKEIVAIDPLWKPLSTTWNSIFPTQEDNVLLNNIAEFSEMVITIGSSTIFDFISHKKPCGYLKYNQEKQLDTAWDVYTCYNYVHFRSMPQESPVFWINGADEMASKIKEVVFGDKENVLANAQEWFETINLHPVNEASARMVTVINNIVNN